MELDDNLYSQSKYYPLDPLSEDDFIGDTQEFSFEVNNDTNIHNSENEADIIIDVCNSESEINNVVNIHEDEVESEDDIENDHVSLYNIREVWKVTRPQSLQTMPQYVILFNDGSHLCTCLWLINRGIVYRHFFRVMSYSQHACFHITLIFSWWYSNKKACIDQQTHFLVPMYQITRNTLSQLPLQPLLFGHLTDIKKIAIAKQKQTPKQKYGLGMGYAKKALDYAIRANKVSEFVNYLETGEVLSKRKVYDISNSTNQVNNNKNESVQSSNSSKRARHCQNCKQAGYYAPQQ
ncbi:24012_t:CDS:2, partial [Gigaspora margarita]